MTAFYGLRRSEALGLKSVSYTHLDVYKRQVYLALEDREWRVQQRMQELTDSPPENQRLGVVLVDWLLLQSIIQRLLRFGMCGWRRKMCIRDSSNTIHGSKQM